MRCILLLTVLICGCGKSEATRKREVIPLDKVPAVVMKAAKKTAAEKFPDLRFENASRKPDGVYEITGKTKTGKIHDIEVTESGEIHLIE